MRMKMKTSDKVLLYSTVGVIGIFLAMDLLHYINYQRGEVLDFAAIEQRDFISHQEEGIHWLVLDGPMRTFFYPADRLKVDIDRSRASNFRFQRHGDTLVVSLENFWARSAHDPYYDYGGYTPVRVFFPVLKGMRIINGFALFDNEEGHKAVSAALELDGTQCWVGNYDQSRDSVYSIEPWDSIKVKGINSNFIVNRQVHVKALDLRLDAKSEFSDRYSLIDTAFIQGDSTTALHLHGRNFNKLHLDEVVHSTP
jgi:hypothetical protein